MLCDIYCLINYSELFHIILVYAIYMMFKTAPDVSYILITYKMSFDNRNTCMKIMA